MELQDERQQFRLQLAFTQVQQPQLMSFGCVLLLGGGIEKGTPRSRRDWTRQ